MNNGHLVYIGDHKSSYVNSYKDSTQSFIDVQAGNVGIWNIELIRDLIRSGFPAKVLTAFDNMKMYPWKAELARYCILYQYGGWYSDFGITFLEKIDPGDADLVVFRDNPIQKLYNEEFVIQTALIFAKPDNELIYETIMSLADIYNKGEYGNYPFYVTGEEQLARAIKNSSNNKIVIGEFGENFVSVENLYQDKQILEYRLDGNCVALFKSVENNERLKTLDPEKTDVLRAWSERELYENIV